MTTLPDNIIAWRDSRGHRPRPNRPLFMNRDTRILDILEREGVNLKGIRSNIYQDECGDVMLITKRMEIFPVSDAVLRCYVFHSPTASLMRKQPTVFIETPTSEEFIVFDVCVENWPKIWAISATRKQKLREGTSVSAKLESRLGHLIYNYRPMRLKGAIE